MAMIETKMEKTDSAYGPYSDVDAHASDHSDFVRHQLGMESR